MKKFIYLLGIVLTMAAIITACSGEKFQEADKEYVLTTDLRDGNLVFLGVSDEINGIENPTLTAKPGETVTVILINGGEGQHDVTFPEVKASSEIVSKKGQETSITFKAPETHGEMEYFDSVGNHAELGMRGVLLVGTQEQASVEQEPASSSEEVAVDEAALAAFQKGACGSCHTIAGVPNAAGVLGPDLSDMTMLAEEQIKSDTYTGKAATAEDYIRESILEPNLFIAPTCPTGACIENVMPSTLAATLTTEEIDSIVGYLGGMSGASYTDSTTTAAPAAPEAAPTTGADVARDPTDLPAPLEARAPMTVVVNLEAVEVEGQLADGTTYTYWTFNGAVPGPFIRVRIGDTIEVHMKNNTSSVMNHSVDFHAVTGPGGGAVMTQTKPGEETMFSAKVINPGLFVYHCATPMVAQHIANGMYGLILVEPEGGLPAVDREFYVMQGEVYTTEAFGTMGYLNASTEALLNEDPEYLVFNGAVGALTTQKPLKANVGENVRIFFGVGGPNFTSSFHVIGEIFDKVFDQASLTAAPLTDVQTTLVPPGGATMVEFKLEVPGRYILVDHALSRLQRGLAGFLLAEGPEAPDIFNGTPAAGSGH